MSSEPQADPQQAADDSYMRRFATGRLWRMVTYGYGFPSVTDRPANLRDGSPSPLRTAKTSAPKRRRTSDPLRAQVVELRRSGAVPDAIADSLNLSGRRVRTLLREADAA